MRRKEGDHGHVVETRSVLVGRLGRRRAGLREVGGTGRQGAPRRSAAARQATAQAAADGPAAAVSQFLEAVRTGNDPAGNANAQRHGPQQARATRRRQVTPPPAIRPISSSEKSSTSARTAPGSPAIGPTWTTSGKPETRQQLWVVRREARVGGWWEWRGPCFEGEPPLLLNFEDPEDVLKKEEWLRSGGARRSQAEKNREKAGEKPGDAIRR